MRLITTALSVSFTILLSTTATRLSAADTVSLIGDRGLEWWQQPTAEWMVAGNAVLDAANPKLLSAVTGTGVLINDVDGRTKNILSQQEFGDAEIHVEWLVSKGSNSGVYVMGRYEVQIFDSFGVEKPASHDAGAIYQRWDATRGKGKEGYEGQAPMVNASKAPGEWQTYDITFHAPRFAADGSKTANALFVKVVLNGQLVQENIEVTGPTRSGMYEKDAEKPTGPLMLQGDHGPVAYRHITVTPLP
jgi:Domain of Unknown Function (DUF1080)